MPRPYAHDHSPSAGERNSRVRPPRDGGRASHGPTAAEQSPAVPGTLARFARATVPADPDRPMRRDVPGRRPHDTHLLAQHASRKDK